jgi:molybdopterin/thiamine biosynthesis adenylyltransferase
MRATRLESAAYALASVVSRPGGGNRLLIRTVKLAGAADYSVRTEYAIQLSSAFFGEAITKSRVEERALVLIHSHPSEAGVPRFSSIDDQGERVMAPYLIRRAAKVPHATLVIGRDHCAARLFPNGDALPVTQVGRVRSELFAPNRLDESIASQYDRQVRAFGPVGQAAVASQRVAIVGLGGTGSIVAQQLSYLGVHNFVLIDPDVVDATNLNRTVGAVPADIGRPKVHVAAAAIRAIMPGAAVEEIVGDVTFGAIARKVATSDFIFSCTDTEGSRAVLGQVAYQYLVPMVDVGVNIVVENGSVRYLEGRAQMFAPGLGCYVCGEQLDWQTVRRDLQTEHHRREDPYFTGGGEPQPAVISLNGVVASFGVTMFLGVIAGIPSVARHQRYDGITGRVRTLSQTPVTDCVVCSAAGALARGDEWPLPTRRG